LTGLDALKQFNQWISYKLVPRENGKTDKIPTDPVTGAPCNAHDQAMWRSYADVVALCVPTAFVFSATDPFWFLDIDNCLEPTGQWSPLAQSLLTGLQGAAFEISQSGTGLHGFGVIPAHVPHGCKRMDLGIEFYTEGRFCAVTERAVIGSAAFTPQADYYTQLLAHYFPAGGSGGDVPTPADWTTTSCDEWLGPDDDTELLPRMMRSKSVRSIMGTGATFKDLWSADDDVLSGVYPDVAGDSGRPFDWSQADAALCSHLAFWTGKNCDRINRLWGDRINRLWGLSALGQRDKFIDRPEYRQSTILRAVGVCKKVYRDRTLVPVSDAPVTVPTASAVVAPAEIRTGFQLQTPEDQQVLFAGCVYIRDMHRIWVPDGGMLKPEQFKAMYGGYVYALDSINDKTTKNAWDAFTESQAVTNPWVHGTCFKPEYAPGEIISSEGRSSINTYVPIDTEQAQGDPAPFLDLLSRLLPVETDREILLAYMAACVQYPGVKFQWAPVIQGTFGNGKSLLTEMLSFCVGTRYTHKVNAQDIDNVFNAWITGKLLIIIDEIKTGGSSGAVETLKWLVTDSRVPIQSKGQDQTTGDNRANIIMCTNYKDGIVKTRSDRRFAVFYTAQQCVEDIRRDGMAGHYFPNLVSWLKTGGYAVINGYLHDYEIPGVLNPATVSVWAPETSSNEQAVQESFGSVGQEVLEAINEGRPGFCGGWISTMALNRLVQGLRSKTTVNQRREILRELGFVKHPALPGGRATRVIPSEAGRPRLYVKGGHISLNVLDPVAAMQAYCDAQSYPPLTDTSAAGQVIQM